MLENIDKTIDTLCEWVQKETTGTYASPLTSGMILALARLIEARASIVTFTISSNRQDQK